MPRQHCGKSSLKYDKQMTIFLLYPLCIGDVAAGSDAQRGWFCGRFPLHERKREISMKESITYESTREK
jgi:hypothetical protein